MLRWLCISIHSPECIEIVTYLMYKSLFKHMKIIMNICCTHSTVILVGNVSRFLPITLSTPPNTRCPSRCRPLWYFHFPNLLSLISAITLLPPFFLMFLYIIYNHFMNISSPTTHCLANSHSVIISFASVPITIS